MNDTEFQAIAGVFQSSQLYAAWRSLTEGYEIAAKESALLRPCRRFASAFAQQPAGRKVAVVATTIGIAALAHLAIRLALPAYTTTGLPWWWNIAEAVFAFGIAIKADAIAKAWNGSTPARVWRYLKA